MRRLRSVGARRSIAPPGGCHRCAINAPGRPRSRSDRRHRRRRTPCAAPRTCCTARSAAPRRGGCTRTSRPSGIPAPRRSTCVLVRAAYGPQHGDPAADGPVDGPGELGVERRRGVRERVGPERGGGDFRHAVQVAPDQRLGQQQRRCGRADRPPRPGCRRPARRRRPRLQWSAPYTSAIGRSQDVQRQQGRGVERGQEPPQVGQLGRLPRPALAGRRAGGPPGRRGRPRRA